MDYLRKVGDTQEEHVINVPVDVGYIEDPSVKPNEEGIMNISADINPVRTGLFSTHPGLGGG